MDGSTLSVILGLTLPLTGTTLGAAMAFFMRRELGDRTQKARQWTWRASWARASGCPR